MIKNYITRLSKITNINEWGLNDENIYPKKINW